MNDRQICKIVQKAIWQAHLDEDGENWRDYVKAALTCPAGPGVWDERPGAHEDQPDENAPSDIVRLADGRMVHLTEESTERRPRYVISKLPR